MLQTPAAGKFGHSGAFSVHTGQAHEGDAGEIKLATGWSENGRGGGISLIAGDALSKIYRKHYDGGEINLRGGHSETKGGTGGKVVLSGGDGRHKDRNDGGNGGSVELLGGVGSGQNKKDLGEFTLLFVITLAFFAFNLVNGNTKNHYRNTKNGSFLYCMMLLTYYCTI